MRKDLHLEVGVYFPQVFLFPEIPEDKSPGDTEYPHINRDDHRLFGHVIQSDNYTFVGHGFSPDLELRVGLKLDRLDAQVYPGLRQGPHRW